MAIASNLRGSGGGVNAVRLFAPVTRFIFICTAHLDHTATRQQRSHPFHQVFLLIHKGDGHFYLATRGV